MKKFILQIALFLMIAFASYTALLMVWTKWAPDFLKVNIQARDGSTGFTSTRMIDAQAVVDVDLLFTGSSHCYRGYDPRIFATEHLTSFNLGSSSQTPLQTSMLLRRHLAQMQPELVIVDVYPVVMQNDGIESTIDFLGNTRIQNDLVWLALKTRNAKVYNTLLYRGVNQALDRPLPAPVRGKKGKDEYIDGGFVEHFGTFKPEKNYKPSKIILAEDQLHAFEDIIAQLREAKVNFIIVQAPTPRIRYASYTNHAEIDSTFASYGRYYNFGELMHLSDTMFFDDSHLNQYGVQAFNTKLIEVMKLDGVFPAKVQHQQLLGSKP